MDFVLVGVIALVPVCEGDGDCVMDFVLVGVIALVPVCVGVCDWVGV